MSKNNQDKRGSDSVVGIEGDALVTRYMGTKDIREMMEKDQYIEAFIHTQLGIEKILWAKIVDVFEGKKAERVGQIIDSSAEDRSRTKTAELIKWAHFLGAINHSQYGDLNDFNKKRNKIIHSHGKWWYRNEYSEALQKAIRVLEKEGL